MNLRFGELHTDGYFHVFNRGTEKIPIFRDQFDYDYFIMLVNLFNSKKIIGSIKILKQNSLLESMIQHVSKQPPLVEIYGYSLLENHYHFVFKQMQEDGISELMRKLNGTYSQYFNKKYNRVGTLFQGKFKYIPINNDQKLIHMISYVNNNHLIHKISSVPQNASGDKILMNIKDQNIAPAFQANKIIALFGSPEKYRMISTSIIQNILNQRKKDKPKSLYCE